MAARRYEISLRELKYIFQHQKRNFVSPTGHVMFCLLLIYYLTPMKYQTISLVHPSLPSLATEDKKQFL